MSQIAIKVEKLGKLYRIGQFAGYKTIRETLMDVVVSPLRRLRHKGDSGPRSSVSGQPSNTIWALRDISFEIKHGEAVGIIGRNGSGKSTLLKILSRITAPTEGRVEICGRCGSLLEVGTGFHPELTGRENIYLNGAVIGMKRAEVARKFDEIVAFAEIEKFLDTPVKRYSSGMYVRLAFAVAAHLEPDVLLVDEVLAVGDAQFQKKCLGKMGEVTGEGRTVLFVSHNMAAVRELCPRAVLLESGHIIDDGPSQKVIADYLSTQSGASSGDMDVTDPSLRRNSLPNSRFHWTRITILNSKGRSANMLSLGEPFELILQGIANSILTDVRLGFAITSALGVPIFNSFQADSGLSSQLAAGRISFRARIDPNWLAPGLYEISIGANGEGAIDWLPYTLQFTVSAVCEDDSTSWQNYRGGVLNYPCKWRME